MTINSPFFFLNSFTENSVTERFPSAFYHFLSTSYAPFSFNPRNERIFIRHATIDWDRLQRAHFYFKLHRKKVLTRHFEQKCTPTCVLVCSVCYMLYKLMNFHTHFVYHSYRMMYDIFHDFSLELAHAEPHSFPFIWIERLMFHSTITCISTIETNWKWR